VAKRSTDGGAIWGPMINIWGFNITAWSTGNPQVMPENGINLRYD
jgi:hypothetical protein